MPTIPVNVEAMDDVGVTAKKILEGFWVCGRVCGDRSVFVTSHRPAHMSRAHASSLIKLCISHLKCFLFAHLPPLAPPCLLTWSLPKFWTNSLFLKHSGQSSWTRDHPGEDMDAPIESKRRRTLIEEHARHYRFQLQLSRQPSDTLLGRLDCEKDRSTFTVINLAKVASVAAQSAHTKHIEVAPGISFNLGTHEPPEASGDSKAMGLAQWLLNLRILYNSYSIIGVRKVATSANCESMWCSWQVVSYFVDTLTDLATANIPGTKMRPTTGVLQLAELNLRTRVVELLRLGAEGGCLTFYDAFNTAFIEKQSLFHCALSPQAQVSTVAKPSVQHQTLKRAADSRTSDRQTRRKTDSQSAEPRPRPQYSKYTPDGTLICPDYNTRGCSLSKCWYKSLNAVHCWDVWGCYKEHPRWDH